MGYRFVHIRNVGIRAALAVIAIQAAPHDAVAQAASGSAAATSRASSDAPKRVHRHHYHVLHHTRPLAGGPVTVSHSPASAGFVPAPVVPQPTDATDPKANLLPDEASVPKATNVSPGTMQLHYPFAGDGYVTGSSPQAMDDATTAKIPGVIVKMPIQPSPPQALPPP